MAFRNVTFNCTRDGQAQTLGPYLIETPVNDDVVYFRAFFETRRWTIVSVDQVPV